MEEAIQGQRHVATSPPGGASDFADVEVVVRMFHDTTMRGQPDRMAQILFPAWRLKRLDRERHITTETLTDLLAYPTAAFTTADISSIQMCFGDFAIARVDAWLDRTSGFHLLFKERGSWRIAGSAFASVCKPDGEFLARQEEARVLAVLGEYYGGVAAGKGAALEPIFAAAWEMKHHKDKLVIAEDRQSFIRRIDGRPVPGYNHDRQIADIQIVANSLAYVRIDKPSVPVTTVFLLLNQDNAWLIVDKAWSEGGTL